MKKVIFVVLSITMLVVVGYIIPLGSYTTTKGCPINPTPNQRLHLVLGDSIQKVKDGDVEPPPNVGCFANTKFVLYLF